MSDNARLEGVVGSGAAQKRGAGTVAGAARGTPPPRKAASAAPGSSAPVSSGGGPSSSGRHAAARAGAREVLARQQAGRKAQPVNELFELPPVFEAAVARQVAFFKRVFSPEALFEPLPPALRVTLSRQFSFFTRIFTQFLDPHQQKEVRQAIPGLARRQ